MSVLILSRELSIFVRVFLMRNAVSLAEGFWYQHSFMSLAMEVKVWRTRENNINHWVSYQWWSLYFYLLLLLYLLGLKTIGLGCWASAGPHTQPFSYPRNWDRSGPRHEKEACSLLRCLEKKQSSQEFTQLSQVLHRNNQTLSLIYSFLNLKHKIKSTDLSSALPLLPWAAVWQNRDARSLCQG